jgi:hypothetical protein
LSYEGRATEADTVELQDEENMFFSRASAVDLFKAYVAEALTLDFASETKRAEWLVAKSGKTFNAARAALRRAR